MSCAVHSIERSADYENINFMCRDNMKGECIALHIYRQLQAQLSRN